MAISAGDVYSELILDITKYLNGFKEAEKQTKTWVDKMNKAGKSMEKVGTSMSKYLTLPIMGVGAASVKLGMDFEANMSRVQAISGATGTELERMNQVALKLGADTAFSATEVATSMEGLASAGFTVNETINALPGLLDLAASSGADLGTATDIAASALRGFQLDASESGRVADVFAEAANRTNAGVEDMGEAMKYIAPVANAMGMSIEETAAAVGILSDAGIKGSQAGTVLRGALTRLTNPAKDAKDVMSKLGMSFSDAQGNMLPMEGIIQELQKGTKGLTQEQKNQAMATLFGQEALSGMLVLTDQGPEKLAGLTKGLEESSGAAKAAADIMMDNTKGAVEEMTGALETAGIKIFNIVAPSITDLANKISGLVDKFNALSPEAQGVIVKFAGMAAAAGPVVKIVGKIAGGIGELGDKFGWFAGAAGTAAKATTGAATAAGWLGTSFAAAALPVVGIVAGIAALTAGGIALYKHLSEESIPAVDLFGDSVSESTQKAVTGYMELDEKATVALRQLAWSSQEVTEEMATSITGNVDQMKNQVVNSLTQQKTDGLAELEGMFSNSKTMSKEEKAEMLRITSEKYDEQITQTEEGAARIAEILWAAKEGNRAITDAERMEINTIQEEMKNTAVQTLSDSEAEQMTIMERLKAESGNISARQAADVVKNSKEQRGKTIAEAEAEYNERLKYAAMLKADGSKESVALANKIVLEAKRQRDESVSKAKGMHKDVVAQAKAQAGEHASQVDWESGQVKSKWQVMKDGVVKKSKDTWTDVKKAFGDAKNGVGAKTKEIGDKVKDSWNNSVTKKAFKWGKDAMQNLKSGIESMKEKIKTAAKKIGDKVKDVLGHSVPKEGPLKDELKWMPHMMENLTKGIEQNKGKVQGAIEDMADDMAAEIPIDLETNARVQAAMSVANPTSWTTSDQTAQQNISQLMGLLKTYLPQLADLRVVLDSGAVVGGLAPGMDRELGDLYAGRLRGRP